MELRVRFSRSRTACTVCLANGGTSISTASPLPFSSHKRNAFVAIGDAHKRLKLISELKRHSFNVPRIIHPSAYVSKSAVVGEGSIIMANAVVQSNVKIGDGVIVNTSAVVDHDTSLMDGVHICPGVNLAGEVKIGYYSWVGIGSSIIQGVTIGSDVTIGAGSVVLKNVRDSVTAVGIPASIINK